MSIATQKHLSIGAKVFIVLAVIFGAIRAIDFLFYGGKFVDLASGIGFAMMAYGTYHYGFRSKASSQAAELPFDQNANYAMIAGCALVLVSFALRFSA